MRKFHYTEDGKDFTSPVFVVNGAFTDEKCDEIIEAVGSNKLEQAQHAQHIEGEKPIMTSHDNIRKSSIIFIENQEIDHTLFKHMQMANFHLSLKYKITGAEQTQFTRYSGDEKGHYTWHQDGEPNHDTARVPVYGKSNSISETIEPHLGGTVRKISMSVILNDDFEGGEMQFRYYKYINNEEPCRDQIDTFKPVKGQAIIFPSDLWHSVRPVTKGKRYSLVKWFAGPPLR